LQAAASEGSASAVLALDQTPDNGTQHETTD
jgi:hypothetical protein